MALDKAIEHGKEKRREWHDSRQFDTSCRNNNRCPWCESNRLHQQRKLELAAREEMAFSNLQVCNCQHRFGRKLRNGSGHSPGCPCWYPLK